MRANIRGRKPELSQLSEVTDVQPRCERNREQHDAPPDQRVNGQPKQRCREQPHSKAHDENQTNSAAICANRYDLATLRFRELKARPRPQKLAQENSHKYCREPEDT
jgi:hypothetical protein